MDKLIKKSPINFLIIFFIFFIIVGWFYFGWPRFFNFLPKIQEAKAAITLEEDNVTTITGNLSSNPSWNHRVDNDSNTILLVGVAIDRDSAVISSITYGGFSLNSLEIESQSAVTAELWFLIDPPTGDNDIIITSGDNYRFAAGAIAFTGVDTVHHPFGTVQKNQGSGAPFINNVVSHNGELVLDLVAVDRGVGVTPDPGQTEVYVAEQNAVACGVSTKPGADLVDLTWGGVNDEWCVIAVPLKPVMFFISTLSPPSNEMLASTRREPSLLES